MSPTIEDGTLSSASQFMNLLNSLQATGASVLADLAQARQDTLFRFQQDFSALTSKQQRAARLLSPDIACRFVTSDFLDVDQSLTSATVRSDSQAVTLRESTALVEANVKSTVFSSATGTVNQFNRMYQVSLTDGSTPTGVFEIQLFASQDITLLVFDAMMPPAAPTIRVFASLTGVTWVEAAISQNGSRVNAWFDKQPFRYLRVEISPSHADTIGGNTFTFGLSNLGVYVVNYQLYSEYVSKPVMIQPVTPQVRFRAANSDLNYYLAVGDQPLQKVVPGDVISLPGVTAVSQDTQINTSWMLCPVGTASALVMPATVYPSTLKVTDKIPNNGMKVAYGLNPNQLQNSLFNEYVGAIQNGLDWNLIRVPIVSGAYPSESGRTFTVQYVQGPSQIPAILLVQLSTRNRALTPVFTGAYLENVY